MRLTKFEHLNKILAIIDACQTDCKIHFSFNLPLEFFDLTKPDNLKGKAISAYLDDKFYFSLNKDNKLRLIEDLSNNFNENEICHYAFIKDSVKIGEGFDYCEINFLNPDYFYLTSEHLKILGDVDIQFMTKIE